MVRCLTWHEAMASMTMPWACTQIASASTTNLGAELRRTAREKPPDNVHAADSAEEAAAGTARWMNLSLLMRGLACTHLPVVAFAKLALVDLCKLEGKAIDKRVFHEFTMMASMCTT